MGRKNKSVVSVLGGRIGPPHIVNFGSVVLPSFLYKEGVPDITKEFVVGRNDISDISGGFKLHFLSGEGLYEEAIYGRRVFIHRCAELPVCDQQIFEELGLKGFQKMNLTLRLDTVLWFIRGRMDRNDALIEDVGVKNVFCVNSCRQNLVMVAAIFMGAGRGFRLDAQLLDLSETKKKWLPGTRFFSQRPPAIKLFDFNKKKPPHEPA